MSQPKFDTGNLLIWSENLEGILYDKIGGAPWSNQMMTTVLSQHVNGDYGERTADQKRENNEAAKLGMGAIVSRYTTSHVTYYVVTLTPLSSESSRNRTYFVSKEDFAEFWKQVVAGLYTGQEAKRREKIRTKQRKASKQAQDKAQRTLVDTHDQIREY